MQDLLIYGLFALVLVAGWVLRSPWLKGTLGEIRVNSSLRSLLDEHEYRLFKDLTLPTHGGTTQIDHVIVSRFGVFVIETKNMKGWIYGGADQALWTQVIYRRKFQFQNPIRQNYKHVKAVQELLGIKAHQLHSVVVFVGSGVPKTAMPIGVVWGARSLAEYIKSKRVVVVGENELGSLVEGLSENSLQPGIRTRLTHVRHVKTQVAKRQNDAAKCPRCGAKLVERANRQSGEQFLGCSRFPRCKGTRKLP